MLWYSNGTDNNYYTQQINGIGTRRCALDRVQTHAGHSIALNTCMFLHFVPQRETDADERFIPTLATFLGITNETVRNK